MEWSSGEARGWGTAHPGYWLPLDISRPRKNTLLILDVGGRAKPAFSPDDPDEVLAILQQTGLGNDQIWRVAVGLR
ncbi:MAG: hypothetical protein DLM62_08150 [Pseudonocardiales bacterium]|nr:MAG: hypothetical protein DLM62_08150 [Pseudonocardiales bacterium]